VCDDVPRIELDVEFVLGFADFDATADPGYGNRVAARVQSDVAFDIDDAFMKPVDLRNPDRKRFQVQAFGGEQLAGNGTEMLFVCAVDTIAPLAGLLIQVPPTGECPAGKEVIVDKIKWPLDACRTIGIATLMSGEAEAEAVAKRLHLGYWNHGCSGSAQDHDVRVVDHHALGGAAEVAQRLGQKDLAVETLKRRITLKEHHARVAEHGRGGLDAALLAGDLGFMWGGVVLQFLTRCEVILAGGDFRFLADAVTAAEGGQRWIGHVGPTAHQFLMDPNQIAFVSGQ
jgi:hypothetical protein